MRCQFARLGVNKQFISATSNAGLKPFNTDIENAFNCHDRVCAELRIEFVKIMRAVTNTKQAGNVSTLDFFSFIFPFLVGFNPFILIPTQRVGIRDQPTVGKIAHPTQI